MIRTEIPGREPLVLHHLVLDYNGTIARDGQLIGEVKNCLTALQDMVQIHILTADTHGNVRAQCKDLPATIHTFPVDDAGVHKARFVRELGAGVACFGNGFNDVQMFAEATLSIAILDREGLYANLLAAADILVASPVDAFQLLLRPDRLRATLRG